MAKLRFTNKAVEDLTSIWNYTFKTWSERQADEYYVWLVEMFWLSAYFTSEWISNAILRKTLTDSYFIVLFNSSIFATIRACSGRGGMGINRSKLPPAEIKKPGSRQASADAEREALEPIHSRNIIKLQITDNHTQFGIHSKSKSF